MRKLNLLLQLLAPYLTMVIFWVWLENAVLAIMAYHIQCLCWSWKSYKEFKAPQLKEVMPVIPILLAGVIFFYLIPHIIKVEIQDWMAQYKLSQTALLWMIPYFGLIHPFIEQMHWERLRKKTWLAHPLFAGYHLIILASLLSTPWLIACFVILTVTSVIWQQIQVKSGNLLIPALSHIFADFGIILAAYIYISPVALL